MVRDNALSAAFARLQSRGHRLTRPRRLIVEALFGQCRAVTAAELHGLLADSGVNLATVYRTLETLTEIGLADTVARPGAERQYVACSLDHHHHLICTRCGRVERLDECVVGPLQALVEAQTNFVIEEHILEFRGRCATCKA